jgi:hypothetical protein
VYEPHFHRMHLRSVVMLLCCYVVAYNQNDMFYVFRVKKKKPLLPFQLFWQCRFPNICGQSTNPRLYKSHIHRTIALLQIANMKGHTLAHARLEEKSCLRGLSWIPTTCMHAGHLRQSGRKTTRQEAPSPGEQVYIQCF